jgi:hypothetical protein
MGKMNLKHNFALGRVHFLCLPKENEPKEKAPLVLACGSPKKMAMAGESVMGTYSPSDLCRNK